MSSFHHGRRRPLPLICLYLLPGGLACADEPGSRDADSDSAVATLDSGMSETDASEASSSAANRLS